MTTLTVTPEALDAVREIVQREAITDPLVSVRWRRGEADLHRAADGSAVWIRFNAGWEAAVLDLANLEKDGVAWSSPIREMHGYRFSMSGGPTPQPVQECRLDSEDGRLVIREPEA